MSLRQSNMPSVRGESQTRMFDQIPENKQVGTSCE